MVAVSKGGVTSGRKRLLVIEITFRRNQRSNEYNFGMVNVREEMCTKY
jgi:hypothetical protein